MSLCGLSTVDMFSLNGDNKLAAESVEAREDLIRQYAQNDDLNATFFVSDSAGKDSQVAKLLVQQMVPAHRIVVVHANLTDEVEHKGVIEHIRRYTPDSIPVHVVSNPYRNLIDGVLLRGKWMSSRARYCTSDYKTSQIDKLIRSECARRGSNVAFNVTGIRAEESRVRALKNPLYNNERLTSKTRTVFDWMPAFHMTESEVFDMIYAANQTPHPVYGERGELNSRLSCVFCVLGNKRDLAHGANNHPDMYASYTAIERVLDHTMFVKQVKNQPVGVTLAEKAQVPVDEALVAEYVIKHQARRDYLLAKKAQETAEKAAKKMAKTSKRRSKKYTVSDKQHSLAI